MRHVKDLKLSRKWKPERSDFYFAPTLATSGKMYISFASNDKMPQTDVQFSKLRLSLTVLGLVLYVGDICTDIKLTVKYFYDGNYVWSGLTALFVFTGLLVTQIFSCTWYLDDMDKQQIAGKSKGRLVALHVLGTGTFIRYYDLLTLGFKNVWRKANSDGKEQMNEEQHIMYCMATDLSMLKLFEAFLESVPQLLLQLYILLHHNEGSVVQYVSLVFSFCNVAWALVDYRRCLRRSILAYREMPSGLPTVVYLLYKLCTITSHILSYSLLLLLSPYTTVALTFLWLLGTVWAHMLQTSFCSSKVLELLYRGVVGVILVFTFFNVKGEDTRVYMITYYVFYSVVNFSAPILVFLLRPEMQTSTVLLIALPLIFGLSVLGLLCLMLYYRYLHPRGESRVPDEVDGNGGETAKKIKKVRDFLQP